jgi:hypothetical protein
MLAVVEGHVSIDLLESIEGPLTEHIMTNISGKIKYVRCPPCFVLNLVSGVQQLARIDMDGIR